MKRLFSILIIAFASSCTNNSSNKDVTNVQKEVEVEPDAFTYNNRKAEKLISKYGLKEISDSIKLHVYRLFYDKEIKRDSTSGYFCFYDLVPLHFDSFPNSEFMIEYVLLSPDSNYTVETRYTIKNKGEIFSKRHLGIPGIHLVDRDELKDSDLFPFIDRYRPWISSPFLHLLYSNQH